MKVVITVEYAHEVNGQRKTDKIDIEREADRKAYTVDAFENHIRQVLEQKGAVKPKIVSVGMPRPLI